MTLLTILRDEFGLTLDDVQTIQANLHEDDFEAGDYRFIAESAIDDIMKEELSSDTYLLGCFVPSFISSIISLPIESVEVIKESRDTKAIEGLGIAMLDHIDDVVTEYVRHDGYGPHFAHYDGHEHEVNINGKAFYAFKVD